ncbi:uncharacterized protein [Chaetodon trifascialis]|uniref:uncharacterized protein n=1 Tax=Chaetodon trifascialis TaxID=109706 RepID=UPI0039923C9F
MDNTPGFDVPSGSTQRTSSPPVRHPQPSTARKRRAVVLSDSSEDEDEQLVMEAEQQTDASASSPPPTAPPPVAGRRPPPPPAPVSAQLLPQAWRSSLPPEQQGWVSRALFVRGRTGRAVLSQELQLWYYPPGPQSVYRQRPSAPDAFFQRPFFFWAPYRMWQYQLKCPNCKHKLTACGVYKTVRKVLDLDGWYYMATEYLECSNCKKKVAGWSEGIRIQLDFDHQQLFPAVLAYKLSCDKKVLALMKQCTLGNSVSRLRSFLTERHTAEWMRQGTHYLQTCRRFEVSGVQRPPPPMLPKMEPVPTSNWLLATYARESSTRTEELKAKVTSVFGSILRIHSTQKVTRKLSGADAGTAQLMTSVGNELGQVLITVLTGPEGNRLRDMANGLQDRYQQAGRDPPQVLYVDRNCCRRDGGTCAAAALFPAWPQLIVRLDICHFVCSLAAGVTSNNHPLYPDFMRRLSGCIFEWDPEDMSRLRAVQSDKSRRGSGLTLKEMSRHCRRRTRGAQVTERLLDETLQAFMGATDTMNTPLLDRDQMEKIWSIQRKHVACIQDPPAVHLYTKTGQVTRGGAVLPVYRCARGSTSLKSFHLYLNTLIPGGTTSGFYFQMSLLEGLTRWNEDRARAAAGKTRTGIKCYSGQEQHTFNQLTQHFYGLPLSESYTKPLNYTGELIGISYLYNQTEQALQDFPDDPTPDGSEDPSIEEEEEENMEELVEEEFEDFLLDTLDVSQLPPPPPPPPPPQPVSSHQGGDVSVGADGAPGHQHVVQLAHYLVEHCRKGYISQTEVEQIVGLWENLPDPERGPVVYPPRYRVQPETGKLKRPSGRSATWPDTNRLVEAIFIRLCILHPCSKRMSGCLITRWSLVLRDYNSMRDVVTLHPGLMSRTTLQLFAVTRATLSQWHRRWTSMQSRATLTTALPTTQGSPQAEEALLPARAVEEPQPALSTSIYQDLPPLEGDEDEPAASTSAASRTPQSAASHQRVVQKMQVEVLEKGQAL